MRDSGDGTLLDPGQVARHARVRGSLRVDGEPGTGELPRRRDLQHRRTQGGEGGQIHSRHRLQQDRKSTRLNSSHVSISYAVFCLKKKKKTNKKSSTDT